MRRGLILASAIALALALGAEAAPKKEKIAPEELQAQQQVLKDAGKHGIHGKDLAELKNALKQNKGLGKDVTDAIARGLKGKQLADFIHEKLGRGNGDLANPGNKGDGPNNAGPGTKDGAGPQGRAGMGQGMGPGGMGPGMGQGMGPGMGHGMGPGMGKGMMGPGSGMGPGMGSGPMGPKPMMGKGGPPDRR